MIAAVLLLAACLAAPFPAPGFATAARAAGDEYWSAQFAPTGVAHVNGSFESVTALASLDGSLYVGGDFSRAGGLTSLNIARWDAATGWTALRPTGPGVGTYAIRDMMIFDGELVVAGDFDQLRHKSIARWEVDVAAAVGRAERTGERACDLRRGPDRGWQFHERGRGAGQLHRPLGRHVMERPRQRALVHR
jgi:hypothetical protein